MAVLVLVLLILAMAGHSSANWCVCKQVNDAILQKAIDYACGAGADCNPIRPNGQCYNPNSLRSHCSYAVNSYYQRKSGYGATCEFSGAATLTASDPSGGGCSFPASSGTAGTGTTVPTTSPNTPTTTPVIGTGTGTTPTVGTTPTTTSPYTTTPNTGNNGVLGGVGTGLGPSGSSMDDNQGGIKLESTNLSLILMVLVISGIMCLWN